MSTDTLAPVHQLDDARSEETPPTRREKGSGSLWIREDVAGRQSWYGKISVNGRQRKKKLGPVRQPKSADGLTRTQATKALRKLATETGASVPRHQRVSVLDAGEAYLKHLTTVRGLKPTTLADYGSILRKHAGPFLAGRTADRVESAEIAAYISAKLREGLKPKTVRNHCIWLHGLFAFTIDKKWAITNPILARDLPAIPHNEEIRFLDRAELESLYRAEIDDEFWPTDRVIYMVASMTGLRQGELIGLEWRDIDWPAGTIRVRRSFTHGEFSTPKSKKSSRTVTMIDRLGGELERHHQASAFQGGRDIVFPHPTLGAVLDASALRKRFHAALERAEVRRVRFHDLRHSYGTAMAAAGTPMRALQELMGHASIATTEIYAGYSPDPTGAAAYAQRAFGDEPRGTDRGTYVSETQEISQERETA
jgi:integrase